MSTPLLLARDARIAVDGIVRLESFSLETHASRWALAGDVEPLVHLLGAPPGVREALARVERGEVTLAGGTLMLGGADVGQDAHLGSVGFAPCDPPLPADLSLLEWTTWSARLSGRDALASSVARKALDAVGMGPASGRLAATLAPPERRAMALALALVAEPAVLVVEEPLARLEGEAAAFVMKALRAAGDGRAVLVSTPTITSPAHAELMSWVEGVSLFLGGNLVLHGAAAEIFARGRLMGLTVRGDATGLVRRLGEAGINVAGGPSRFSIALPDAIAARDVMVLAAAEGATVVELLPLV